jgi:hypothetical protein
MSIEIVTALIALGGVLLSVIVSLITNSRQTANELAKLRSEIQQSYAGKLLEKRLEVYPHTYALLSEFAKKLETGTFTIKDLESLYKDVNELNPKTSIFFSAHTGDVSFWFRKTLRDLLKLTIEELKTPEKLGEIKKIVSRFELSLKSDLGIYVVEFSDPSKRFSSYSETHQAVIKNEPTKPLRK